VTLASLIAVMGVGVGGMVTKLVLFLSWAEYIYRELAGGLCHFFGQVMHSQESISYTMADDQSTDLVPASKQHFLTLMSIFWCLGQLLVNLVCFGHCFKGIT